MSTEAVKEKAMTHKEIAIELLAVVIDNQYDSRSKKSLMQEAVRLLKIEE